MRKINIIGMAVLVFAVLATEILAADPAVSSPRPNVVLLPV